MGYHGALADNDEVQSDIGFLKNRGIPLGALQKSDPDAFKNLVKKIRKAKDNLWDVLAELVWPQDEKKVDKVTDALDKLTWQIAELEGRI